MINKEIAKYIEKFILPQYKSNDKGHGINHIMYVIERSFKFADTVKDINLDMVYVIAAYHDIGHKIDVKNHEVVSAQLLLNDEKLKEFFTDEQMKLMSEAIEDHRASLTTEPRSIYGKIVSSADRNVNLDEILMRTYEYRIKHSSDLSIEEIIDESYNHIMDKFGKNGYATNKMYFEDPDYETFLKELEVFLSDRKEFFKRYCEVNNIQQPVNKCLF